MKDDIPLPRRKRYLPDRDFRKLQAFSIGKETPFLVIDLDKVGARYDELKRHAPKAKIYYAVKANSLDSVLMVLADRGSNFDVASIYEIDHLLRLGISPERMSFGNTIKKARDIAYAYSQGVRLFTTDSFSDVEKLAENAPGSKVMFRLLLDGEGADWPLSRKFGAHPDMIFNLILKAKELGLSPCGVSFHVGSQQRDIGQWDNAIALCRYLFDSLRTEGIKLRALNLGGGLPAHYLKPTPETEEYMQSIKRYLKEDFPKENLDLIFEPGRSVAGDVGTIVSEVSLISNKSEAQETRWVYLDIGKFGGLIETLDESIKYPIFAEKETGNEELSEVILAGPTCDSFDILYENYKYKMPDNLKEGDRVYILSAGAYTASYSSVNFNGFPPLQVYTMGDGKKKKVEKRKPQSPPRHNSRMVR